MSKLNINRFGRRFVGTHRKPCPQIAQVINAIAGGGARTWTNMPAAKNDFMSGTVSGTAEIGRSRPVQVTYFTHMLFSVDVNTAGSAGSTLSIEYSLDDSTWNAISGSSINIASTGVKTAFFEVPQAAREASEAFFKIVGQGGNGTADPNFEAVVLGASAGSELIAIASGNIAVAHASVFESGFRKAAGFHFQQKLSRAAVGQAVTTWANMPAALTEFDGATTERFDLFPTPSQFDRIDYCYARLVNGLRVAGAAGAVVMVQYSLNGGMSWQFIDSETGNTGAPVSLAATGRAYSSEVLVDRAAIQFNGGVGNGPLCRIVGQGGDGVADPVFDSGVTGMPVLWYRAA